MQPYRAVGEQVDNCPLNLYPYLGTPVAIVCWQVNFIQDN
jgi:hypothetical protein